MNYAKEDFVRPGGGADQGRRGPGGLRLGGQRTSFAKSLECLAPLGMLVLFGQSSGPVPPFNVTPPWRGARISSPAPGVEALYRQPRQLRGDLPRPVQGHPQRRRQDPRTTSATPSRTRPRPIARSRAARRPERPCSCPDGAAASRKRKRPPPAAASRLRARRRVRCSCCRRTRCWSSISLSLLSRNSMASTVPIGVRMRRSTHIFDRVPRSTSSSSLRVPRLEHVDRRPGALVGQLAVEHDLRVAGALELPRR